MHANSEGDRRHQIDMTTHYQIRDDDAATSHHPVDDMEPIDDTRGDLADALVRVVVWQISGGSISKIAARTMLLATALDIGANNLTYEDIASACGITRGGVQLMAIEIEDQFGIKTRNSRKQETRTRCKIAQKSRQR